VHREVFQQTFCGQPSPGVRLPFLAQAPHAAHAPSLTASGALAAGASPSRPIAPCAKAFLCSLTGDEPRRYLFLVLAVDRNGGRDRRFKNVDKGAYRLRVQKRGFAARSGHGNPAKYALASV
jgi:hypothetical protein